MRWLWYFRHPPFKTSSGSLGLRNLGLHVMQEQLRQNLQCRAPASARCAAVLPGHWRYNSFFLQHARTDDLGLKCEYWEKRSCVGCPTSSRVLSGDEPCGLEHEQRLRWMPLNKLPRLKPVPKPGMAGLREASGICTMPRTGAVETDPISPETFSHKFASKHSTNFGGTYMSGPCSKRLV